MVWLELCADLCVDLTAESVLDQIQGLLLSCLLPGMPVSVPPVLKEKQSYMTTLGTYCSKSWWHKGGIIKQHPDLVKKGFICKLQLGWFLQFVRQTFCVVNHFHAKNLLVETI